MKKAAAIVIVSILFLLPCSCGRRGDGGPRLKTVLELDSGWSFRQADGNGAWLPATVPGCVHTDLFAAGVIPDPFFGDNEKTLQWIGRKEWVYRCDFTPPDSLLSHSRILIEFEGLDTYASVSLNGVDLLDADNMFRKWSADIKPALRNGENTLEVRFHPPGPVEEAKKAALGYALPGGDMVFTRKAAYH